MESLKSCFFPLGRKIFSNHFNVIESIFSPGTIRAFFLRNSQWRILKGVINDDHHHAAPSTVRLERCLHREMNCLWGLCSNDAMQPRGWVIPALRFVSQFLAGKWTALTWGFCVGGAPLRPVLFRRRDGRSWIFSHTKWFLCCLCFPEIIPSIFLDLFLNPLPCVLKLVMCATRTPPSPSKCN